VASSRIIVLHQGALIADGLPADVIREFPGGSRPISAQDYAGHSGGVA